MGRDQMLAMLMQDELTPNYVAALKKGKVETGKIRVYKGKDNFVMRWEAEGSSPLPKPAEWEGPLATVKITGHLVKDDDAYKVVPVPTVSQDNPKYQKFLSELKSAMTTLKRLIKSALENQ
jgi:hypothetical protein